ncbi:hypothetical protein [Halopseudomonas pelagia]|uniref:hypothetical protein n=1 Tax=Halopseudomonas pelagia TaxID=553151 RepID=UPI00039ACF53|nr:hypothetical protein [Halopseudomonas pelagia]|tara:strand:+ start:237534 stop:239132 length:1599 start_codon:yes stop_codon:yes gene_type:complete
MSTEEERKLIVQADIGSLRQSLNSFVLPIEKNQCLRLTSLLDNELMGINDLSRELLRVPAAALQICRAAGGMARAKDLDILTLEQACNMLGTLRLAKLLRSLPIVEREQMPLAYRQLLSISEHALTQAQGLFANRMARLWHEVSLASLLFLAPCWVLIYHRPELFKVWDARALERETAEADIKPWLLDSDHIMSLTQQLAEDWWLPPWILQGYRSLNSSRRLMVKAIHIARDSSHPQQQQALLDADRSLSRWLTMPANSLLMANGIALGAHHDWDARHTGRWQQLTALYLGCSLAEAQSASHINAVDSARSQYQHSDPDLWLPAQALLWQTRSRKRIRPATPVADTHQLEAGDSPKTTSGRPDPVQWRQQCLKLLAQPSAFASLPQLLHCALDAMDHGLGLKQSWIALYNAKQKQLIIRASRGFDPTQEATDLALGDCRNTPWGQWLKTDTLHNLDAARLQREGKTIPDTLTTLLADQRAQLLPLQHRGSIIGLLGAQGLELQKLADEKQRKALLKTAECIYRALINFQTKA